MASFNLKILTPEKEVFNGEALKLVVRTTEGDIGIYAKHIDYVAPLSVGKLEVTFESGKNVSAICDGFITVQKGNVTILTDFLEWSNEIDINRAEKAKEKAEQSLQGTMSETEQNRMEVKLKKALNRINVAKL